MTVEKWLCSESLLILCLEHPPLNCRGERDPSLWEGGRGREREKEGGMGLILICRFSILYPGLMVMGLYPERISAVL